MRRYATHLLLAVFVTVMLLPQAVILWEAWAGGGEQASIISAAPAMVWGQLRNTLLLGLQTVLLSLGLGFGAAFCVTRCAIPLRRTLSVLLCLPIALPAYVVAAIAVSAAQEPWVPSLQHLPGAALILALTLYPWVYIPAKAVLVQQSRQYQELALSLGLDAWQRFWRVHLWLLLPTIGVTGLLVFMAVINDIGTAEVLGIRTLSVGINDAMFNMYRRDWAAQLAAIGLALPVIAVLIFAVLNAKRAAYSPSNRGGHCELLVLGPLTRWLVVGALGLLLVPALLLPVGMLLYWSLTMVHRIPLDELPGQLWDTVSVTLAVGLITVAVALVVNLLLRRRRGLGAWQPAAVAVNLNYALPGIMLGIALLFASADLPSWLVSGLLSNSVGLLVLGGCLAYCCFPFFTIRAGYAAIAPDIDDLCAVLGMSRGRRLLSVDLPLLRRAIACGLLLVLVNMAKELPLSLALQPFGYQSLSLRLYTFAGVQMLEESAIYSLCLLALVAYPIIALDGLIMRTARADL